ncbi:hypothetical protein NC651_020564 [Populus alba x Populus x berolinensis]|nr:hypothetical protein NC651_020564 [Populus alba x Populus x berolinensis]
MTVQHNEKSFPLKTMEDGQVLMHSDVWNILGAVYTNGSIFYTWYQATFLVMKGSSVQRPVILHTLYCSFACLLSSSLKRKDPSLFYRFGLC